MNFKPLGSEPAAIASAVETAAAAVLALLLAFHVGGLSAHLVGIIMAALTAVAGTVVAFVTHHPALSGVVAAVKACAALAIAYGAQLTPDQVAVILGAVAAIVGLWLRTQTSPRPTILTNASTVVPGEVVTAAAVPPVAAVPAKKTTTRKRPAKKTSQPTTSSDSPSSPA